MLQKATTNTFTNGMLLDQNPMTMPNTALSGALNATLVTRDGNELILQLDKGNGRVETAYLPEGFVPIGTVEFGGIIYIASYNPLTNRSEIGCFPSPERNITSDELNECLNIIDNNTFIENKEYTNSCLPTTSTDDSATTMASIKNKSVKLKILSGADGDIYKLNPGDRYKVFVSNEDALAANSDTISDIYIEDENTVDVTPRYLTIRMIALADDGKIIYLDKNLKWDWNGLEYGYYINGDYSKNADGTIDLDDYRSLVSSAYNVFNSKVSGELALLFDLKVISTMTLTWDAEVYTLDELKELDPNAYGQEDGTDKDRWALIYFYVNYQSDDPRINMRHVVVTGSYIDTTYEDTANGCPFGSSFFLDKVFDPYGRKVLDPNDSNYRKNDGTDADLEIVTEPFRYSVDDMVNTIWNYEMTPAMPFGNIDWLAIKGSINFKLLGSGIIDIIEWRYYISSTSLTLSWALEAYPERNKLIFWVEMQFYDSDDVAACGGDLDNINPIETLRIDEKKSYSGYFLNILVFEDTLLLRDKLYLVKIIVKYGSKDDGEELATDRIYLRWLYTTGQWNDEYLKSNGVLDFKELTLADVISFNASYDVTDNILKNTATELTNVSIPSLNDSSDEYTMLGAVVTIVNYHYNPINPYFASDGKDFEVDISINSENSLFSTTTNEFKFELDNGSIINTASVLYDTNESAYGEYVKPLIAEIIKDGDALVGMPEEAAKTVLNICTTHIENADYYKSAIDSFNALIQLDSSNKKHFDVKVLGMIYSKIDADIVTKTCAIGQVIRPMLYFRSDLNDLNLYTSNDVDTVNQIVNKESLVGLITSIDETTGAITDSKIYYNTYHLFWGKNKGSNAPVIVRMQKITQCLVPGEDYIDVSMKDSDNWSLSEWSDGEDYENQIVSRFNDLGGPLLVVLYLGDEKSHRSYNELAYGGENHSIARMDFNAYNYFYECTLKEYSFGLWIKNGSNDSWIPLNFFVRYTSNAIWGNGYQWWNDGIRFTTIIGVRFITAIVASIYNSIYKFDSKNSNYSLDLDRTDNITWLGNLNEETWTINIKCSATVNDENIFIGNASLNSLLKEYLLILESYGIEDNATEDAQKENITFGDNGNVLFNDCVLTHLFSINNSDLFLKYSDLSVTNIPYGAFYDDSKSVSLVENLNSANLYVRTPDGTLTVLNDNTALYIYLSKELTIEESNINESSDYILCTRQGHMLGSCGGASVFGRLEPLSDEKTVECNKSILSLDTCKMYFLTHGKADSKNTSTVNNCSFENFGVNYIDRDGKFDMTLHGDPD